jgi:hypothetical protein
MITATTPEQAVLNQKRWEAWIEKGKRRDRETRRKFRVAAWIGLAMIPAGILLYRFWAN